MIKKKSLYIIFLSLSLAGYGWLALNVLDDLANNDSATPCLFKHATGLPCPSCGTSRSLLLLAHGDVRGAVMMNPLGLVAALALVIVPLWILADVVRKKENFYRRYLWMEQLFLQRKWASTLAVMMVLLNWFWNIAKGI